MALEEDPLYIRANVPCRQLPLWTTSTDGPVSEQADWDAID